MVRYIILSLIFFISSCKTTEQIVKVNNDQINIISFDAVTKTLDFNDYEQNQLNNIGKQLIYEWYNDKIKTDGFEGSLKVIITNLDTKTEKREDYFKVTANISIQFKLESNTLSSKKSFNVSASEFSEISGKFSILDQENLSANTLKAVLNKITIELNSLN